MKRPDRNELRLLAVLLLTLGAAGCGGMNASVPISPMMFMKNSSPPSSPTDLPSHALAANDTALAGH